MNTLSDFFEYALRPALSYGRGEAVKSGQGNAQAALLRVATAIFLSGAKNFRLGMFDDQNLAAEAYLSASEKHFGAFARAG